MHIVIIGLSITSSWGNGHATTYRGLIRALARQGHRVTFLEHDKPWYAANRDLPHPPYGSTVLYADTAELQRRHADEVAAADAVIVGSYVPEGVAVGDWVQATAQGATAFYDIDTPVTLSALAQRTCEYLRADQIAGYDCYLSFTGGPTLQRIEHQYGSPAARALYCSVDPEQYAPMPGAPHDFDLGYLGTYSPDRQPPLDRLMLQAAIAWPQGRFVVAGPQYPEHITWPANVQRTEHLPPAQHRAFYCRQCFTLNITRADMLAAGWSPSVRLFEAAACGVPIVSDWWEGLDNLFQPGSEILVSDSAEQTLAYLRELPDAERAAIGTAARQRVLGAHTADHRARELVHILQSVPVRPRQKQPA